MKRIILTACLTLLIVAPALAAEENNSGTMLDITAEAHVKAAPDIATISSGVITVAAKADQAMAQNSQKMNQLFQTLKAAGIPEKEIQTSGINLSPQYDYKDNQAPVIKSYQASNTISIILHDMKTIGPVLDSLIAQGANQINGPDFSVENTDPLLDKARAEAVAKAKKRAEIYAQALGLKIKRIVSISEHGGYNPPRPVMMRAMAAGADQSLSTPVAAGEMNLGITANMRFELE